MTCVVQAFMANVERGNCWLWRGQFMVGGTAMYEGQAAHRPAHEIFLGPINPGNQVIRLCANPRCVRPEHLDSVPKTEATRLTTIKFPSRLDACRHDADDLMTSPEACIEVTWCRSTSCSRR